MFLECALISLLNLKSPLYYKKTGFKSELGGRSRAKAGIMQRISMVALRATARQVIRGAANVQAHSDRRAEKTAEAAKYDALLVSLKDPSKFSFYHTKTTDFRGGCCPDARPRWRWRFAVVK